MFGLSLNTEPPTSSRWYQRAATADDDGDIMLRYRAMRAMAGTVAEARRRADAMARLELSLGLTPAGVRR